MSDNYIHCRSLSESFVDLYTRRRVLLSGVSHSGVGTCTMYLTVYIFHLSGVNCLLAQVRELKL